MSPLWGCCDCGGRHSGSECAHPSVTFLSSHFFHGAASFHTNFSLGLENHSQQTKGEPEETDLLAPCFGGILPAADQYLLTPVLELLVTLG